jgi:hypothetical protein
MVLNVFPIHVFTGNLIGSEGAAALAPMMEFLPSLTALHLDCEPLQLRVCSKSYCFAV